MTALPTSLRGDSRKLGHLSNMAATSVTSCSSKRERVLTARSMDLPSFNPMGRDERVQYDGYAEQDVTDVARQLSDAARLFANVLSRLGPQDWGRSVMYNYPDPCERSLRWVAVHTVHEIHHHTLDVRDQLA